MPKTLADSFFLLHKTSLVDILQMILSNNVPIFSSFGVSLYVCKNKVTCGRLILGMTLSIKENCPIFQEQTIKRIWELGTGQHFPKAYKPRKIFQGFPYSSPVGPAQS